MKRTCPKETSRGLRLGVFGTFYPEAGMAGNSSTGLVAALAKGELSETVVVFSQYGASLPKGARWPGVKLVPCWKHDKASSLIRALRELLLHSPRVDGFLFNTYITAFGRSVVANATGLLLPASLALLTRKPVVVYMHNFLETQDANQLGYRPSRLQRWGVRFLERLLLRTTTVIVPLESQQATILRVFHTAPRRILVPFAEPFGLIASLDEPPVTSSIPPDAPTRVLLLGHWGPQKDLLGAIEALLTAQERGGRFTVSITGAINVNFPAYRKEFDRVVARMDPRWFRFIGHVPESELLNVVDGHDLAILPYNATGGYSGAMSVGAYCGIGIIAYDLPQLRETAIELGIQPVFVTRGDTDSLAREILTFSDDVSSFRASRPPLPRQEYDIRVRCGVELLIKHIKKRNCSLSGVA